MIGRLISIALGTLMLAQVASAEELVLSESGTFLGRVSASDVSTPIQITISLDGDKPVAAYVMARFQNNAPQHRTPTDGWVPWSETSTDLIDAGFKPNPDGTLTFALTDTDLSMEFLPVIFTVAYALEGGSLKSGYMVIGQ